MTTDNNENFWDKIRDSIINFSNRNGKPNGWITRLFEGFIWVITSISLCILKDNFLVETDHRKPFLRSLWVDTFIFCCFFIDIVLICLVNSPPKIIDIALLNKISFFYFGWRIFDILSNVFKITLFDSFDYSRKRRVPSTVARTVTLGFLNFIELGICFGGIYAMFPELIYPTTESCSNQSFCLQKPDFWQPFHLSFITQSTIGYGDIFPTGWLRYIAWLQGFSGIVILVLLLGKYISLLASQEDKEQSNTDDILIAFSSNLENFSDEQLQFIGRAIASLPPERVQTVLQLIVDH